MGSLFGGENLRMNFIKGNEVFLQTFYVINYYMQKISQYQTPG